MISLVQFINEGRKKDMKYPLATLLKSINICKEDVNSPEFKKMLEDNAVLEDSSFNSFDEMYDFIKSHDVDDATVVIENVQYKGNDAQIDLTINIGDESFGQVVEAVEYYHYNDPEQYVHDMVEEFL